jgi:LDH2 family malate/lactate/ureidoglycolate dehydrogenase
MAVAVIRDRQMIVGAPWVRMVLGTNPFAYGLPGDPPVVLDVATSVIAMQKVRVAAAAGEALPRG